MAKMLALSSKRGEVIIAAQTPADLVAPIGIVDTAVEKVATSLEDGMLPVVYLYLRRRS